MIKGGAKGAVIGAAVGGTSGQPLQCHGFRLGFQEMLRAVRYVVLIQD